MSSSSAGDRVIPAASNGVQGVDAKPAPACDPGAPEGCAICGDEALPARVLAVDAQMRIASVLLLEGSNGAMHTQPGVALEAALDLVDGITVGDLVLVHQGFVIGAAEAA